jgi:uncharacterized protein YbaP (TraB family)
MIPRRVARAFGALVTLAAVCTAAWGQTPTCPPLAAELTPEQIRQDSENARDHGFLWRVGKDRHVSFLYGTVHVAEPAWMFPGPAVRHALGQADTVVLEIDTLDEDNARRLQAAVLAPAGAPALPPPLAKRMAAQAQRACVGNALARMRPEMQAVTLVALAARTEGLDPAYSIDGYLAGFARGLRVPVVSLETPEQQIGLLTSDQPATTRRMVDDALTELERGDAVKGMVRLAHAWRDGDLNELDTYPQWCQCMNTPAQRDLQRRLVDDRNQAMAERIDALHADGHVLFVAVGSLHMIGPKGLPALLAARGFVVQRVHFPDTPEAKPGG